MALIIGPISGLDTDTDDPTAAVLQAVVQALQDLQPATEPHHIRVTSADPPPDHDRPVWRWTLSDDAPPVLDPAVSVHVGTVERGRWAPTHPHGPAEIRRGLVVAVPGSGWAVVGAHQGEDDDHNDLVEQALAHVAALYEAE